MSLLSSNPVEKLASSWRQLANGNGGALLAITLLAFAAFGAHAFNVNLVADDWGALIIPDHQYRMQVMMGRWLQALLWIVLDNKAFASSFTVAALFGLNLISGLLALRLLAIEGATNRFLFLGLFLFFPFWAEIYLFNQNHVAIGLATLLATLSGAAGLQAARLVIERDTRIRWLPVMSWVLAGAFAFSLSASLNQALFPLAPMLAAGVALQRLIRSKGESPWREALAVISLCAAVSFLGILLYGLEVLLSRAVLEVGSLGRGYGLGGSLVTSAAGLKESLVRLLYYFDSFLFGSQHLFPLFPKIVFLICICCLSWIVVRAARRQSSAARSALQGTLAILLILGLLLLPWALGFVREQETYRFRALMPVSMTYAAVISIAIASVRLTLLRGTLQLAALATVLVFVFEQSVASNINISNLRRDLAFATRLVDRMESDPAYQEWDAGSEVTVFVVGRLQTDDRRPFADQGSAPALNHSLVNCGIVSCLPDQAPQAMALLQTGVFRFNRAWVMRKQSNAYKEIENHLSEMRPWPDSSAVKVLPRNMLILYLSEPE